MDADGIYFYDLSPGKTVGDRYKIHDANRQGGLSTAFEAVDLESGERCELQLFPGALFDAPEQLKDFSAILAPWKHVDSPWVVRVREIVPVHGSVLALITDLPEGATLRERLKRKGRLPAEEVVGLGLRLLEGLQAVHAKDLVHGDVKPSTIHVSGEGADVAPVLVDGGVTPALWTAKDLGDKTAMIGTPYYAPVEQFGGDSPNVQSDVYNVAAVLFESLAGCLPWVGSTFMEVFQAKLDKALPSMRKRAPEVEVAPELEKVIATGCLAVRTERYASALEFHEALSGLA
jgi:serine/threonine protein kinase